MVLSFPINPIEGQVYQLWIWDGQKWACNCGGGPGGVVVGNGVIGMPSKTFVFNNSATYTPTPGITSVIVECIGGGGAGGWASGASATFGPGGGGGSGAYSRKVLLAAQIGTSQLVTIGAGGIATASSSSAGGAAQANGAATSFGSLVTANGGTAGGPNDGASNFGFSGGGASIGAGELALPGIAGGYATQATWSGSNAALALSGAGGGEGGGYPVGTRATVADPGIAGVSGGGGSGGSMCMTVAGGSVPGGAGGSGWCIVTEYSF